jgi:hypothetical protein
MMPYQTERSVLAKELELRRHVTSIHRVSEKGSSRKPTYRLLNGPRFAPVLGLKMPAQGKKTSRKFFEGGVLWTYLPLLSGPWWAHPQAGCSCICLANSRTSTSSAARGLPLRSAQPRSTGGRSKKGLPLFIEYREEAFSETELPLYLSSGEHTLLRRRIVSEPVISTLSQTPAEAKPPITSLK